MHDLSMGLYVTCVRMSPATEMSLALTPGSTSTEIGSSQQFTAIVTLPDGGTRM